MTRTNSNPNERSRELLSKFVVVTFKFIPFSVEELEKEKNIMSVSAIFGTRLVVVPQTCSFPTSSYGGCAPVKATPPPPRVGASGGGLVIESSSRPQKKATAHHRKSRPKKTQPWDIKRGPTVYPPLPELPPEWTLVTDTEEVTSTVVAAEAVVSSA